MKSHPLKVAREERGWSQSKLAKALGVSARTVGRWELYVAVPHPYYREQLSLLFGKTVAELGLLDDSDKNAPMLEVVPVVEESPGSKVVAQLHAGSLDDDVQLDTHVVYPTTHRRFSYQALRDVGISRMRRMAVFRVCNSSSRRSLLIIAMILLAGLVIIAAPLAFKWLSSRASINPIRTS